MDKKYKSYVKLFNKYDLYTKNKNKKNIDQLKVYYRNLINKFIQNISTGEFLTICKIYIIEQFCP